MYVPQSKVAMYRSGDTTCQLATKESLIGTMLNFSLFPSELGAIILPMRQPILKRKYCFWNQLCVGRSRERTS